MRTAEELVEAALAEVRAIGKAYHAGARIPMYRRLTDRQQVLFGMAATWRPDFAGWTADVVLTSGRADLSSLLTDDHPTLPGIRRVTRASVHDQGSGDWTEGTRIRLVQSEEAALLERAPRASIRSGWLEGIGDDLAGIAAVRLEYERVTRPMLVATDECEMPSPHDGLLALDLAKWMVLRLPAVGQDEAGVLLEALSAAEKEGVESWRAYVIDFSRTSAYFDV